VSIILSYHPPPPFSLDTMSTSPAKTVVGFDVLANKIWVLHRVIHPTNQSTHAVFVSIGWKVKSLFIKGAGKRKVDPFALAPTSAEHCLASVSITPDTVTTTPFSTPRPHTNMMRATPQYSLANPAPLPLYLQVIAPLHVYNWVSILQPVYKCLTPKEFVRLKAGDDCHSSGRGAQDTQ
jgi:hypothetical protein